MWHILNENFSQWWNIFMKILLSFAIWAILTNSLILFHSLQSLELALHLFYILVQMHVFLLVAASYILGQVIQVGLTTLFNAFSLTFICVLNYRSFINLQISRLRNKSSLNFALGQSKKFVVYLCVCGGYLKHPPIFEKTVTNC